MSDQQGAKARSHPACLAGGCAWTVSRIVGSMNLEPLAAYSLGVISSRITVRFGRRMFDAGSTQPQGSAT